MSTFDDVRYVMALLLLVWGPGSLLYWFPIHPLAKFWRRIGAGWAYLVGFGVFTVSAVVLAVLRRPLLSVEFGTHWFTIVPGVALSLAGGSLRKAVSRHLKMRTLLGGPELSPPPGGGRMLDEGAYAVVRHPRYAQIVLSVAGWALISNYLAAYGVLVFLALGIAVLIPMEERELLERFGPAYEEYRRRVPALVPRLRRRG